MAALAGKLEAWRGDYAPVSGTSKLNRLELPREIAARYHKLRISQGPASIEVLSARLAASPSPVPALIPMPSISPAAPRPSCGGATIGHTAFACQAPSKGR